MDWQFTMERKDIVRQYAALIGRRGTELHRRMMAERLLVLVVLISTVAYMLFRTGDFARLMPAEIALLFFAVVGACMVPVWLLGPVLAVQREVLFLAVSGRLNDQLGPRRVTVDEKGYCISAQAVSGRELSVCRPLATVVDVTVGRGGLVVWFRDSGNDFVPRRAFTAEQSMQECRVQLMKAGTGAAQNADGRRRNVQARNPGLFKTPQGILALRYTFPEDTAAQIYTECFSTLYRRPEYWLGQWKSLLALLVTFIVGIGFKIWPLVLIAVFTMVGMLFKIAVQPGRTRKRAAQGLFDDFCGPQTIYLQKNHLLVRRAANDYTLPYSSVVSIDETEHALFVLQKSPRAILPIPKSAFADEDTLHHFWENLCDMVQKSFDLAE